MTKPKKKTQINQKYICKECGKKLTNRGAMQLHSWDFGHFKIEKVK